MINSDKLEFHVEGFGNAGISTGSARQARGHEVEVFGVVPVDVRHQYVWSK